MQDNTVSCVTDKDVEVSSNNLLSNFAKSPNYLRPLPAYPSSLQTKPIVTQYAFLNPEVGLEYHL